MGKYIAGIIAFIALAWTIYVGINIASFRESVSPYSVFPSRETIIVANRPFNYEQIAEANSIPQNELLKSIFNNPERVQHIYIGSYGEIILLERSKPWTIELAKQFFKKNNVSADLVSSRKLKLSNGWYAVFDDNFLVLSASEKNYSGDNKVNWNYLDKKSSYSLISWNEAQSFIQNVYHKADGTILYVSDENTAGEHLADDQDAFSDAIPADLESYTFYEKEYLRSLDKADQDFFTWINSGAVVLKSNGKTCVVTDFLPSQDPIAILGDKVEESSLNEAKTKGFVKNSKLPETLLTTENYYIEVFNNRVYISDDKSAIDNLIGVYESGKTLTQNVEKYAQIFGNAPKKVSFREISGNEHKTMSLLVNSKHTVVRKISGATVQDTKKPTNEIPPLRIDGGIEQILPVNSSNFIYVLSKSGTIYGVENNEIRWKIELGSKPVSPAAFSIKSDGLLIVTANDVHQIGRNGIDKTTPRNTSEILAATAFSWKGQDQLCVIERNGIHITTASGRKTAIQYNFANSASQVVVWVNKGELRVSVLNGNKFVTFSADKRKKLKEINAQELGLLVKTDQGPFVYEISGNSAQKTNWNGEQFAVLSGVRKMDKHYNNRNLIFYLNASVAVTDLNGATVSKINLPFANTETAGFIDEAGSKSAVAVLDGIANRSFVFGRNGNKLTDEGFEGSSILAIQQRSNGSLIVVSQLNGYLVRYPVK